MTKPISVPIKNKDGTDSPPIPDLDFKSTLKPKARKESHEEL
jgi:hypothetical protein